MEIRVENQASQSKGQDPKTPLLKSDSTEQKEDSKSFIAQAISQTFKCCAYLASRLPTGVVLAFRLLSPILSNQGECNTIFRSLTAVLLALCALSCFLLSFTDSFKDAKGNTIYGFATFKGFWIIDRNVTLQPAEAAKMKLSFVDFLHALMSSSVFVAVALLDQNVVSCFYPTPSAEIKELLSVLPVGIGVISSLLFVTFPTQRHGIGFVPNANK